MLKHNIEIVKWDTYEQEFTFQSQEQWNSPIPVDLTWCTIRTTVLNKNWWAEKYIDKKLWIISNPQSWKFIIRFESTETNLFIKSPLVYDIEIVYSNWDIETLFMWEIKVIYDITF